MSGDQRWRRTLALGALLAGLAALLVIVLARDDSHSYRFMFENAGQPVARPARRRLVGAGSVNV